MTKKLVFSGGLGNQMFQYAFLEVLRKHGKHIIADISLYRAIQMHNGFELNHVFNIQDHFWDRGGFYLFALRCILHSDCGLLVAKEQKGVIDYFEENLCPFIKGDFQSELYFENYAEEIRKLFTFRDISIENENLARQMRETLSVSLHFRRGDYVSNSLYDNICSVSYYKSAIQVLSCLVNADVTYFIFSNEVEWAHTFMMEYFPSLCYEIIDINSGKNSYMDMYLMSQCSHNIIANSSFSWWGAWLNQNPDKIVIAPKKWANEEEFKYRNMVPKTWIKI